VSLNKLPKNIETLIYIFNILANFKNVRYFELCFIFDAAGVNINLIIINYEIF
jgi:hypothetical protein